MSVKANEGSSAKNLRSVIAASSAGTLIEWYDFYIFGSLATILATQFFPKENPTAGLLSTLATFAAGFVVRPFGSLVFGRIGDVVGRKHAFLVTLLLMGVSTFLIGLVPGYSQIGILAPILVLLLRLTQGLALGGEYGGAATYVAEHAPDDRRGYFTSYIQTTATLGLLVSIIVIIGGQSTMSKEAFEAWGWRIPFLMSSVLVIFSYLIRRRMEESPLFAQLKAEGKHAENPIKESFGHQENRKLVLIALFGATMGQGVVWYTGQFYALIFLQSELKVEKVVANILVAVPLILATPLFIATGALSDRIGRKPIILLGCLLASILYIPLFSAMSNLAKVDEAQVVSSTLSTDWKTSPAKEADAKLGIEKGDLVAEQKLKVILSDGSTATESIKNVSSKDGMLKSGPHKAFIDKSLSRGSQIAISGMIFLLVVFVTMVYGPIAAFLVELFPTKIRYSSMSLPYHIGNGVFGGLVPVVATATVAATGIPTAGLYYPIAIAAVTFVVGLLTLPNKKGIVLAHE